MATTKTALVCLTAKQKAEAANFYAFMQAHPNFAGRRLVNVQWGGDPPDVLCLGDNKKIGVELIQWIDEVQTGPSKARFKLEKSYMEVIQSETETPPANIGMVQIYAKDGAILAVHEAAAFRKELYKFARQIDADWSSNPEWSHPQGHMFVDFTGYLSLTQHLSGLKFDSRGRYNPSFGNTWIMFRAHGGGFTPDWMCVALLDNINRKIAKYAKPQNQLKLQQHRLDEFYLLAYYDEAVLYNTLYDGHGFGFQDIGAIVGQNLAANSHPFDKVFLYSPIEKTPVLQVWPLVG